MTKTIEEQIAEARDDLAYSQGDTSIFEWTQERTEAAVARDVARAASRLATLEAVRDGQMVEVYATVCVNEWAKWNAHGCSGLDHREVVAASAFPGRKRHGDAVTVLRGYAHVPSTQVHEVEADSEVVL